MILLDTHILLYWFGDSQRLTRAQRRALDECAPERPYHVSDISLWEIATLWHLERVMLDLPLTTWLERAVAPPLAARVGISPEIAAETTALPRGFHKDPADRILVATAKALGATLLTNDRRIKDAHIVPTI